MGSINYTGRFVDYFIFQDASESGQPQIHLQLGGENGGSVTTGIQKVSQTFTNMLLTRVGTMLADSTYGTEFMEKAQAGMLRTDADVKDAFDLAAETVRQAMRQSAVERGLPLDERLATVTLTSFSFDRGASKLTLVATLTTDAGSSRTVYLPTTVAIR